MLWHSEDILICLSGELSAKFLNNNRELVEEKEREREREREREEVIGRKRKKERKEEKGKIETVRETVRGRAVLLSAVARICLTILFPCGCRTFRRR